MYIKDEVSFTQYKYFAARISSLANAFRKLGDYQTRLRINTLTNGHPVAHIDILTRKDRKLVHQVTIAIRTEDLVLFATEGDIFIWDGVTQWTRLKHHILKEISKQLSTVSS
ncbi:hypothetical protein [Enterococcus nangangensis]|uniref:hypothetical protein n=1 Tax=Enterococcus nangangensis TaxID=2559926 RepID=UPI0010F9F135|nr:hypothetical protein [Enterococcus nangangensis]